MKTSVLHSVGTAFDERNAFLHIALGTVSILRGLRSSLSRYHPALRVSDVDATDGAGSDDPDVLYWLLGLVSLSQQMLTHRPALHVRHSPRRTESDTAPQTLTLRELLE